MTSKFTDAYLDIAKSYNAEVQVQFSLTDSEGIETPVFAIMHDMSQKLALILAESGMPIEFDTPSRKTMWVNSWGLVQGTRMFLIDDGHTESVGIYGIDGGRREIAFNSRYNTLEVYYRIRKMAIEHIEGNKFIIRPKLSTLDEMPTVRTH